jgi:hypothetical protein
MSGEVVRPFRWDVRRRNELGTLAYVAPPETYPEFEDDLLECAARVLAFAGNSDLVFIGRSPQPLFDLLSGLLIGTSWSDRLRLLNVSLRRVDDPNKEQLRAIYPYFEEVGLEPHSLARRTRTVALVDVVAGGETLGRLFSMLEEWTNGVLAEWRAVARKLRIVGLTYRRDTSPKTWRWQQHAEWVDRLRPYDIKNVAIPWPLWDYLANEGPKTNYSFEPLEWGDEHVVHPVRDEEARLALALAVHLFDLGTNRETRRRFARQLADQPAKTESWFRSLALEIKR